MYEEFYAFTGKPFQLTPDQKFYFNSKVHNRAMSYLQYGLEQREGFIVITGPVGTGKTMLVRNLFGKLDQKNVLGAQLVSTQVEPEDMLRMVCSSFGLPHTGVTKAGMLHNLESMAAARYVEGKRVLLVVDEAQNLPSSSVEELRMLSNFQVDGRSLFQSFLLGQEEFKRTLALPDLEQFRQRIIASYHLESLDAEETRNYVEYRLGRVGWDNNPSFEPATYAAVHRYSGGVPRRINTLCDRLLLFACLEELHVIGPKAVEMVALEMGAEVGGAPTAEASRTAAVKPSTGAVAKAPPGEPGAVGQEKTGNASPADSAGLDEQLGRQLMHRMDALEQELETLKASARQDRKLLKKALLMQLDLDDETDHD